MVNKKSKSNRIRDFWGDIRLPAKFIWINLLAVVIPVSLIFILAFSVYIQYLDEQLKNSEYRSLSQTAKSFEQYLNELSGLCKSYTTDSDQNRVLYGEPDYENPNQGIRNNAAIINEMKNVLSTHKEILGCYLFCENGNRYKLHRSSATLGNVSDQAWYIAAKNTSEENMLFADNLLKDYVAFDMPVLSFLGAINNTITGEYLGAVLYLIDASHFDSLLSKQSGVSPSVLMITSDSGRIIYNSDMQYINKLIISHEFMSTVIPAKESYYVHRSGSQSPIAVFSVTSASNRFKVVEMLPLNEFFWPVKQTQYAAVFILILCIGFMLLIIASFSLRITRPIRALSKQLEDFKNPDGAQTASPKPKNEIRRLDDSFHSMMDRINSLITNIYSAQIKQKEAELNALQSKVNPHFLYNTLEMISAMANDSRPDQVTEATRSLGKLLQYSLRFENELVTVQEEMESIKHYMLIQQMRFGSRFHMVIDLSPNVLKFQILKLLIQPLIENAIYHGLEPKIGQGTILVNGHVHKNGDLEITVADNGVGIPREDQAIINESLSSGINGFAALNDESRPNSNRGFALMNIHSRLQLCYGADSGLTIASSPLEGTSVTLMIRHRETSSAKKQ